MKALVQRVSKAEVVVDGKTVSNIDKGMLILLGVIKGDCVSQASDLAEKLSKLRIFEDEQGKMNLSVKDIKGECLVVSQFTLAADTSRGNRPGFDAAALPLEANKLYEIFCEKLQSCGICVKKGIFGADMKVSLTNDGPVTLMLEK